SAVKQSCNAEKDAEQTGQFGWLDQKYNSKYNIEKRQYVVAEMERILVSGMFIFHLDSPFYSFQIKSRSVLLLCAGLFLHISISQSEADGLVQNLFVFVCCDPPVDFRIIGCVVKRCILAHQA